MKTKYQTLKAITLCALASIALAVQLPAEELTDSNKEFLAHYEKIHLALAADDLVAAKKAAAELGEEGKALANADKIENARAEFDALSEHAIELAKGQDGFYVARCPMVKKRWVQTSTEIKNPYFGKEMLSCGVIKK